jgi:hypothetical protein
MQWKRSNPVKSFPHRVDRLLCLETAAVMSAPHRAARPHGELNPSCHGRFPSGNGGRVGPWVATGAGDVACVATCAPATPLLMAHRWSSRVGFLHLPLSLLPPRVVARLPDEASEGLSCGSTARRRNVLSPEHVAAFWPKADMRYHVVCRFGAVRPGMHEDVRIFHEAAPARGLATSRRG